VDKEGGESKPGKSVKEMIENITSQQAMPEVKVKKMAPCQPNTEAKSGESKSANVSKQFTVKEVLREGWEEKLGKSVKGKSSMLVRGVATRQATSGVEVKVTTSEKPDTKARPGDMSVKREVSLSTVIKEKSRVWESNKPVKKMASKFVVKKASQAKQGKELSGLGEGEEKLVIKK
jgi:hypothetical protein